MYSDTDNQFYHHHYDYYLYHYNLYHCYFHNHICSCHCYNDHHKINIIFNIVTNIIVIITIIIIMTTINNMITVIWKSALIPDETKAKWLKWFVGSKNVQSHVENQIDTLIMSCHTRVLKISQYDWSEVFWAITQMQNYSGCNGNYINFYAKLVPKIIMTELFKKHCFWFLLIEGKIVPKT